MIRQPRTVTDVRRVLRVFQIQDLNCVRYGGADPRVLALLDRAGCADACGPYLHPAIGAPPPPPDGLRSVLTVAAVGSGLILLTGLSGLTTADWFVSIGALAGAVGLVLTWGAWHRRTWAPRGFLVLAGFLSIATAVGYIAGRRVSLLGPSLFIAIALAVFSMRRWYSGPETR